MATYSTTAIVNKALVLCGATTVTAITDDTPNARAVNTIYEIARKTFLTECRWSFSTTRSTMATVATSTIAWFHTQEDETYVYTRPDALRVWEVSDIYAIWREEGDYLIADTAGLGVKYAFDQSDLSKWRPSAIEAFIDKLCADISFMIINDPKKAQIFLEKYEKISLPKAKSDNSQTGFQQTVVDDAWTSAKYYNSGGDPSRSYG